MIVVDTNVISEMAKASPSPVVAAWLDAQLFDTLFLSSVSIAEIGFGIAILPAGRRRTELANALERTITLFASQILTFDEQAARRYADLGAKARKSGKGFPAPDGYIAAIADANGFAVATRNVADFVGSGIETINPWDYQP